MTSTITWIRPLTEGAPDVPARGEVRGSQCRTRQGLFAEWAAQLGFPGHFGHNWDAFEDCLRDLTPTAVVVREAGQLLAEEPDDVLDILLTILGIAAQHGGGSGEKGPALLLLLDDDPGQLADLGRRLASVGRVTSLPGSAA